MIIDCQNVSMVNNHIHIQLLTIKHISTVNNCTHSRWLFTIETIEIHYRDAPVFPFISTFESILGFIES